MSKLQGGERMWWQELLATALAICKSQVQYSTLLIFSQHNYLIMAYSTHSKKAESIS